jgi:SAM-dependent methyltransferase
MSDPYSFYIKLICFLIIAPTLISLIVSYYVYDLSDLYKLNWIDVLPTRGNIYILNIHAGFDETSASIKNKLPVSDLQVFDFYDIEKHTEVSIKRARKAYPSYPNTKQITSSTIPLNENVADLIFVTLSAHEIRDQRERSAFFADLTRVLKPSGNIIVTEHLRDIANFAAYNIGFFHFLPRKAWLNNFKTANLNIIKETKTTPFITTFILSKNGTAS